MSNSDRIATAQWLAPETTAARYRYEPGSFWLGRTMDFEADPIGVTDDRHVLVVGGTRGGKGTTILINNLCLWPGSALVIDPKGENATVTAARRGIGNSVCNGLGQQVHVLDPYHVADVPDSMRSRFNPLDWINIEDPLCTKKAERLATSLVPFKDKQEDYWDNEARGMIGVLIVHIASSPRFAGRRTLQTLRDVIMRGEVDAHDYLLSIGKDNVASPLTLLWQGMIDNDACAGYVRDAGTYFADMCRLSDGQWSGIRSGVKVATDFLTSAGLRDCLLESDFSISDLKTSEQGTTIYLSIPQDFIRTDCGWLRMMIDMTATEMKLTKGQPANGYPVLMMLDEFAGLQRMDVIEDSIAQLAGYGMKMVCVVQNIGQLKSTYQDNWETFISGAGVKLFFGNEDNETREYVSKLIGETEITRALSSQNETIGTNQSTTAGSSHTKGSSTSKSKNFSLGGGRNRSNNHNMQRGVLFNQTMDQFSHGGGGGINLSRGWAGQRGSSESHSTHNSTTTGDSHSNASGHSESLHKRALLEPHQVGAMFSRVDEESDPRYPGLALVLISGQRPLPIRKCNYFQDPAFVSSFTPHPDFPVTFFSNDELNQPFSGFGLVPPPTKVVAVLARPSCLSLFDAIDDMKDAEGVATSMKEVTYRLEVPSTLGTPVKVGELLASDITDTDIPRIYPTLHSPVDGYLYAIPELGNGDEFTRLEDEPAILIEVEDGIQGMISENRYTVPYEADLRRSVKSAARYAFWIPATLMVFGLLAVLGLYFFAFVLWVDNGQFINSVLVVLGTSYALQKGLRMDKDGNSRMLTGIICQTVSALYVDVKEARFWTLSENDQLTPSVFGAEKQQKLVDHRTTAHYDRQTDTLREGGPLGDT